MKKLLWITFNVFASVLFLAVNLCTAAQEPVKIGVISIFSGGAASQGEDEKDGINLAVKEKQTILGRPIQIVWEDAETNTDLGVRKAEKLVFKDNVAAIFGAGASSVTLAVAGNLPRLKVPMVSSMAMSTKLYNVNKYYFRGGQLADDQSVVALARGIASDPDLKNRKFYVLVLDYEYGRSSAEAFIKGAKENNIEIVNPEYDRAPVDTTDWSAYINKIKASGATAVYTGFLSALTPVFQKQATEFGLMKTVRHVAGGMPMEVGMEAVGNSCAGVVTAINYAWDIDTPESRKFAQAFWDLNKKIPGQKSACAYVSAMMLFNAIEKAHGTAADKVIEALENSKFDGPYGQVFLGKDHSARHSVILVEANQAPANAYGAKMYFKVLKQLPAAEVGPPEPVQFTPGKNAP